VKIVEVGPRDGLQNEKQVISTEDKITYIELLVDAGLSRIEAVSFARPDRVPQMADAEAVMAGVPRRLSISYIGLVMNERGLERAIASGVNEANIVVVATETFSQRNQGMSVKSGLVGLETMAERASVRHSAAPSRERSRPSR
jgi:hydroxymethylglutaryl-CoA lyase